MATLTRFEDLECWRLGRQITQTIYRITRSTGFKEDLDLRRQMRRAAVSMTSNIAEGFERDGNKEFMQFLCIAKGSAAELKSQIYIAFDEKCITKEEFDGLYTDLTHFGNKTAGLINYLKRSDHKGQKFKT